MKFFQVSLILLLSAVCSCLDVAAKTHHRFEHNIPLRFESNIPGVQDDMDIYADMVELMKDYSVDGGPVGYLGVFQGDVTFDDGTPSLMTQMKDADIQWPVFDGQNRSAIDANTVTCSPTKCLDAQPDDTRLSSSVNRGKLDSTACEVISRFIPIAGGAVFALIGGLVCVNPAGALACTVFFGALGGALGDFGKDKFKDFCDAHVNTDNSECKEDGIQQGCKDKRGATLQFMRSYQGKSYSCAQAVQGHPGAKCQRVTQ